ncbi:MAG: nucleotide exchange factor GrpE [Clostridia bacterium]|nr:nucleotide exchange factor GrpE [Clostridia bacterium]
MSDKKEFENEQIQDENVAEEANEEITETEQTNKQEETEQTVTEEESESNKMVDDLKNEIDKQKDSFVRLAAEYENFRKRSSREKDGIYQDATAKAIETLLPVLDSLEFAIKSNESAPAEFQKGLELIETQFEKAFEKLGVSTFGVAGDEFDPNLHNAVSHIDDDTIADNTIVEIFQTGYKIGDRVIRYAMVKVAN